jgi:hypothetical protein
MSIERWARDSGKVRSTSLTIGRAMLRHLAAAMALVMTLASLPSIGVIVFADRSEPCISMDICHPLHGLDQSPSVAQVARPAPPDFGATIFPGDAMADCVPIVEVEFAEAPDPPPPRPLS